MNSENCDKIQAEEDLKFSLEEGIFTYENIYKENVQNNKLTKDKLKKYVIPLLILDVSILSISILLNFNYQINGYIFASVFTLTSIPNVVLLDKFISLLKSIKETKELEGTITYLKCQKELLEEKINESKYDREPVYTSDYSYTEKKDNVKKLVKKKNKH